MNQSFSPEMPAKVQRLLVIGLVLFCASLVAHGQSMPGYQAPAKPATKENLREKAARGEAPLNQLYSSLDVDSKKVKRLGPLSARERNKRSEKVLSIGVVRHLMSPLK